MVLKCFMIGSDSASAQSFSFSRSGIRGLLPCLTLLMAFTTATRAAAQGTNRGLYTFTTLAGQPETGPGWYDGIGSKAHFTGPAGMTTDSQGNIYLADTYNSTIRKVTPAGVVSTV